MSKPQLGLDFDGVIVDMDVGYQIADHWYNDVANNFDITIISARKRWGDDTKRWGYCIEKVLKYYQYPFKKVVYCNNIEEKIKYINSCGNIDLYVDDRTSVVRNLKIPAILFGKQPKIINEWDFLWVKNWIELNNLLMDKHLFSPGPVHIREPINIDFSHRGPDMIRLYNETRNKLRVKFGISKEYEILFINGSATAAIEAVISSLIEPLDYVCILSEGEFGNRLGTICEKYSLSYDMNDEYNNPNWVLTCQFETSCSKVRDLDNLIVKCHEKEIKVIVDAVSSFGYYVFPSGADVVVTSSAKILGGLPVMGIVIIKKELLSQLNDTGYYLNLKRYVESAESGQTPHTTLLPQLISLNKALDHPHRVEDIHRNSVWTSNHLNFLNRIGDAPAPVLTYKFPEWVDPMKVYNKLLDYGIEIYMNPKYHTDQFQIACFSEREFKSYQYLVMMLKHLLKKVK
jgi:aspartate aminotransferase-like enzyme